MERGDWLVLPMQNYNQGVHSQSIEFCGRMYHGDTVSRLELSLEECETIVANIPLIIDFIVRNHQETSNHG